MNNQEKLVEFIERIGIEMFVSYLNMIFNDDSISSMEGKYNEFFDDTGDVNLAIIKCIEEDFSYI